jgi:hypothetical protein
MSPLLADIVEKVENRTTPKILQSCFLDVSTAATQLSADTKVSGPFV